MRLLKKPYQGYLADIDQTFYFRFDDASTATVVDSSLNGSCSLQCVPASTQAASLFDPTSSLGARSFSPSSAAFARSALGTNGHLTTSTNWSFSGFASFGGTGSNTATFLEYALDGTPSGDTEALALGIYYLRSLNRLCISFETAVNTFTRLVTTASIPATSRLGIVKRREGTGSSYSYSVFVDDDLVEVLTTSANPSTTIGSAGRWILGASLRHADASGSSVTLLSDGRFDEVALWPVAFSNEKMASLYGDCVRPFDEAEMFNSQQQNVFTRVLVADSTGMLQDFSKLAGRNHVLSATINRAVEEASASASIKLQRRFGPFMDLSPLNTTSEVTSAIDFRRKVVIQRAVVPVMWAEPQGWEWETRFEGYIDSWSMPNGGQIEISCLDQMTPLVDNFILDGRAFNFYSSNKLAETHIQEIIDKFVPKLGGATLGYLGGRPVLYTEAGSAYTPTLDNSGWLLRYNDVSPGPTTDAIRAVSDMIAYDLRFRYHEPWGQHRLTMFNPPREKQFPLSRIEEDTDGLVLVKAPKPHGLNVGQTFSVSGVSAASFGGTFTVGEVVDYYRFKATAGVSGTPTVITTGTITYGAHRTLQGADVLELEPVRSSIADIRNHIVVKYNREGSGASLQVNVASDAFGTLTVTLPSSENAQELDPDNSGIEFTISGCVTNPSLNANYTGLFASRRSLQASQTVGALLSENNVQFESEFYRFRQAVSSNTPSILSYGLLPAGVYEASSSNIDSSTEAQALADRILSDLSTPQADLAITTRLLPLDLHDTLDLAEDAKGRWSGTLSTAVVGTVEEYSAGKNSLKLVLRGNKPSAGKNSGRILLSNLKPGFFNNNVSPIVGTDLNLGASTKHARSIPVRWNRLRDRRNFRHDRSEIHVSTASGFIPSKATLAGATRGSSFNVTHDGTGAEISPGTTYYVKIRHRDIFDNVSITSQTANADATSASLGGIMIRYLPQAPGVLALETPVGTAVSSATRIYSSATFTPVFLPIDTSADAASVSYDATNAYSTSSMLFRAQTGGKFSVNSYARWYSLSNSKPAGDTLRMRLRRFRGDMVEFGAALITVTATATSGPNGIAEIALNGSVFCNSGDFLRVDFSGDGGQYKLVVPSTATVNYPFLSIVLDSEK